MSDSGTGEAPAESLVIVAFDGPEPLTLGEVVATTGVQREDAETALEGLVTAGRLGVKEIDGTRVWYATPGGGNGATRDAEPAHPEEDDEADATAADWDPDEVTVRGGVGTDLGADGSNDDRVEAAVEEMEMPGTSEMMRDWRRDALLAAFEYLCECDGATSGGIVDEVFPSHQAGYTDPDAWWDCVAPRLAELPGVDRDGDDWEFVGIE